MLADAVGVLVEFVLEGPPVSLQTRYKQRKRDYSQEVGVQAAAAYGGREPYVGMARVEITFFYDVRAGDVDNIAKPILDGLKGIVLADDGQVMDVLSSKRPIAASRFVDAPELLLRALATGREFVHVRVVPFAL